MTISVIDTGIGISKDVRLRLFEDFAQGDASITRRYGGTGLGLAICRRLVTAMGGHIGVKSSLGQGSRFYFDITLEAGQPSESPKASPAPPPPPVLKELNILVAEDGDINRRVVTMLLTKEGHKVAETVDGQQALEAAARDTFDVILMDLQMPVMDGLEATRQIRQLADPKKSQIPIIALTANAMTKEREAALAAGMDGFVAKPFQLEKLKEELATVLARREDVKEQIPAPA
jgi:CheY-like chemotaxis protein